MSTALQPPPALDAPEHEILKTWIAAILWMIVIAIESTTWLSSHNTSRILYPIFHFLFGVSWQEFQPWNHVIRKCGHVVGYGILSVLLFRAWRATFRKSALQAWALRWSGLAVLGTLTVASLDEWHQTYLPSRTGRWQDVVLDTSAGILFQALIYFWTRSRMSTAK